MFFNLNYKKYILGLLIVVALVLILYIFWAPQVRVDKDTKELIDYKYHKRIVVSNVVSSLQAGDRTYYINRDKTMVIVSNVITNDTVIKIFKTDPLAKTNQLYPQVMDYNFLDKSEQAYYQILLSRINIPQEEKLKDCEIVVYLNF